MILGQTKALIKIVKTLLHVSSTLTHNLRHPVFFLYSSKFPGEGIMSSLPEKEIKVKNRQIILRKIFM